MTGDPPTIDFSAGREIHHYPDYHRPRFYRYRIADPGLRLMRNRYANRFGAAWIGLALTIGRHAYCVKWADARIRFDPAAPPA